MRRDVLWTAGDLGIGHDSKSVGMALALAIALTISMGPAVVRAQDPGCPQDGVTVSWIGGGETASWHDVANWSTGQVPAAGDVVCIEGAGVSAVVDTGTAIVGTLHVADGAGLVVANATLEIAGPAESTIERLVIDNGTLAGAGTRTITGLLDLRRGTLIGSATTAVAPAAELRLAEGAAGAIAISGGHVLRIEEGATARWGPSLTDITLEAPSSLVNAGTLEVVTDAGIRGSGSLVNTGSLVKLSHGLTTIAAPFDNDGLVTLEVGILDVLGEGLDNAGTLGVARGALVRAATYRQPATGTLEVGLGATPLGTSSGGLVVSAGPLELAGALIIVADPTVPLDATWRAVLVSAAVERVGEFEKLEGLDTLPGAEVRYTDEGVVLEHQP